MMPWSQGSPDTAAAERGRYAPPLAGRKGRVLMAWRRTHEDEGLGCAPVPPDALAAMEQAEDAEQLRAIVERVLLADRATKEKAS